MKSKNISPTMKSTLLYFVGCAFLALGVTSFFVVMAYFADFIFIPIFLIVLGALLLTLIPVKGKTKKQG